MIAEVDEGFRLTISHPATESPLVNVLCGSWSRRLRSFCSGLLLWLSLSAFAAQPPIDTSSPGNFFTNVAARLLRAELNLELEHIQIYPTNQYTPVVHRLLQLTANLYDATTNRAATAYPFLPSIFRPLFRRDSSGAVFIAGYREVTNEALAQSATAPLQLELDSPDAINAIPPFGTPFGPDRIEPLVWDVPLIIGVKKGFPNFNEFAMQTGISVTRLLEFRRDPALPPGTSPIIETNQMYLMAITNWFGLEAWNPYTNTYPRNLELIAAAEMRMTLTNEEGVLIYSNQVVVGKALQIPQGSWHGSSFPLSASFVLPWGTTNMFPYLTNSTYTNSFPWFVGRTHEFQRNSGFYTPQWVMNLNTKLKFTLLDTEAQRIVDYVNIDSSERPLDLFVKLREGSDLGNPVNYTNAANLWVTNRLRGQNSPLIPTYGILNQIMACLNGGDPVWASMMMDPTVGQDAHKAVDFFRVNMGLTPLFNTGNISKSNAFYAPFSPFRPIYIHTMWQANDPLLHRSIADLTDLRLDDTNRVDFASHNPPLDNLGLINNRYEPWGGNPAGARSNPDIRAFELAAKDPGITRPDDWSGSVSEPLSPEWIGNVHRGTPWQTLFLKSTNIFASYPGFGAWQNWIGVSYPFDALALMPTNDWRIASLLVSWFNTNHPISLSSVNQKSPAAWTGILDGRIALTNTAPYQAETVVISSDSPQAAIAADALDRARAAQPGQVFRSVGDICATPELSVASPWLNTTNPRILTDAMLEILPAQLLTLLRPDSMGSISPSGGDFQVQFTGLDGYPYALEYSTNLSNWQTAGTYFPSNGVFKALETQPSASPRYFRSTLLP